MAGEGGFIQDQLNETVEKVGGAVSEFRAFLKNYNVVLDELLWASSPEVPSEI